MLRRICAQMYAAAGYAIAQMPISESLFITQALRFKHFLFYANPWCAQTTYTVNCSLWYTSPDCAYSSFFWSVRGTPYKYQREKDPYAGFHLTHLFLVVELPLKRTRISRLKPLSTLVPSRSFCFSLSRGKVQANTVLAIDCYDKKY